MLERQRGWSLKNHLAIRGGYHLMVTATRPKEVRILNVIILT